jgi:hypothetical protein
MLMFLLSPVGRHPHRCGSIHPGLHAPFLFEKRIAQGKVQLTAKYQAVAVSVATAHEPLGHFDPSRAKNDPLAHEPWQH